MNKKPLRVILITFLITTISFFVLGTLFYLFLLLPPVQLKAVNIVSSELNKVIVGDISIGKVKSNLLSYIDLVDVSVKDRNNSEIYVYSPHIRVHYSLPSLLKKRIRIFSIESDRLDAHLRVTKNGVYKIPFLPRPEFKTKSNSSDWDLKIGTLHINDINATYNDSLHKMYSRANNARCVAKFPKIDSVLISFEAPDGYYYSDWWHGTVDTIATQVTIQKSSMNVSRLYVNGSSTVVNGYGKIQFNYDDNWDLHVVASSNILPVYALKTYVPGFGTEGKVQLKASWTGTFRKPLYTLELSGKGISYQGIKLDTFSIRGKTDKNEAIHLNASANSGIGKMKLDANVNIFHLHSFHPVIDKYSIDTKLIDIRLPALADQIQQLGKVRGDQASINVHLSGIGYKNLPKAAQVDLSINQIAPSESLSLSFNLKKHFWKILSDWGENNIIGNGTCEKNGKIAGNIEGTINNPLIISKYFFNESVNGNLSFKSTLSGAFNHPLIKTQLRSNKLRWRGVRVDSLNSEVIYDKRVFLEKSYCSVFANLDSLVHFLKIDLKGDCNLKIEASGFIDKPEADIEITGRNIRYKEEIADHCYGRITMHGIDSIYLHQLALKKGKSQVVLDGGIGLENYIKRGKGIQTNIGVQAKLLRNGTYIGAGNVDVNGSFGFDSLNGIISAKEFNIELLQEWLEKLNGIQGIVSFNSSITGSAHNPGGLLSIQAENPFYNGVGIKVIKSQCVLKDSLLHFDSTEIVIDSTSKVFTAGTLPLRPGKGWIIDNNLTREGDVYIQSDNLNLDYFSRLMRSDWKFYGSSFISLNMALTEEGWTIGGVAGLQKAAFSNSYQNINGSDIFFDSKISGTLKSPSVSYTLNTGKLFLNTVKVDSTKFVGSLENDSLRINNGLITMFNGGVVNVNGVAPLKFPNYSISDSSVKLNFKISGLSMTELNLFTGSDLIRGGMLSGSGILGFDKGKPVIDGKLLVDKGKFIIEGVDPSIESLTAELLLKKDTVKIVHCKGKFGSGSIESIGFLVWSPDSLKDVAISGRIRNASIELPDIAAGRIQDFKFSFLHRKKDYLLSGTADIGPTSINRDIRIGDFMGQPDYSMQMGKEEDNFLKHISLQIKLNMIENPTVDINLGFVEFTGDLSITGNAYNPTFTGEISVVNGDVLYLDRQFTITSGNISNYDPYALNPSIDLKAQTTVVYDGLDSMQTVTDTVILHVHGDLKKIKFNLSTVNNPLSEADIISILTLGQRFGNVGDDLKQRIMMFASQSLLGLGTRKLEQFLDIDRINVSGDIFAMNSSNSAKLTVAKRISPKLMVTYETAIADLRKRKISALYRLTKYFFLSGETENEENEGKSGIDFIFKFSK